MPKETFFNLPEEKRQRILDLAIEEFAHHDYQNASISRIVAEASIAKGSFYQYFEDKADLYRYLLNLIFQEKQRVLATIQPPDPQMGNFLLSYAGSSVSASTLNSSTPSWRKWAIGR